MNKENTLYLKERFPFLRTTVNNEGRQVSLHLFGFECGDGWFSLIRNLCWYLELLKIPDFQVNQVKEKFAGLRFYPGSVPKEKYKRVFDFIAEAEKRSYEICEECGCPGQMYHRGNWMKTICDKCAYTLNHDKCGGVVTKWVLKKQSDVKI